jgi:hypothetical protein
MFRFFTVLPDFGAVECCRMQVGHDTLKNMVDLVARSLDYYPERPALATKSEGQPAD